MIKCCYTCWTTQSAASRQNFMVEAETELKLLRSTDSFRHDLQTFLFHSVYKHQDMD